MTASTSRLKAQDYFVFSDLIESSCSRVNDKYKYIDTGTDPSHHTLTVKKNPDIHFDPVLHVDYDLCRSVVMSL